MFCFLPIYVDYDSIVGLHDIEKKLHCDIFSPNDNILRYCESTIQAKVNNFHSNDINKFNKQADKKVTYVLFQKLEHIYVNREAEQVFK